MSWDPAVLLVCAVMILLTRGLLPHKPLSKTALVAFWLRWLCMVVILAGAVTTAEDQLAGSSLLKRCVFVAWSLLVLVLGWALARPQSRTESQLRPKRRMTTRTKKILVVVTATLMVVFLLMLGVPLLLFWGVQPGSFWAYVVVIGGVGAIALGLLLILGAGVQMLLAGLGVLRDSSYGKTA